MDSTIILYLTVEVYNMHSEYYNSKHEVVPSVTTVIKIFNKDGLLQWANAIGKRGIDYTRYLNNKAIFGTLVHELIESDLLGKEPAIIGHANMLSDAMELVNKFKLVKQDLRITNVMSEVSLSCDTYGGTIDLICDIISGDGKYIKVLGDFKTSKTVYETQFIQLGGYLNLIKINMPDVYEQIQQCVIFSITANKIVMRYISKEDCETYFTSIFLKLLDVYNAWNDIKNVYKDLYISKQY